jgi:hypothetical protein
LETIGFLFFFFPGMSARMTHFVYPRRGSD